MGNVPKRISKWCGLQRIEVCEDSVSFGGKIMSGSTDSALVLYMVLNV